MRLKTAAKFFDRTLCQDAFAPGTTLYGQMDVFDDSKRDGPTVVRRVFSTAPDVVIPARAVLTIDGAQWIVGQNEPDYAFGEAIRNKYILLRADGAASIRTLGQAIAGAGGTATYGAKAWVKDAKEVSAGSSLQGFFNVYLPAPETAPAGAVVLLDGRLHLVRNTFKSTGGYLVAESDELDAAAVVAATYRALVYVPSTDTVTPTDTSVTILQMRFQNDFAYTNKSDMKFEPGDMKAFVRKSQIANAKVKDRLVIAGTAWLVLAVADEADCWGLHIRRAGS